MIITLPGGAGTVATDPIETGAVETGDATENPALAIDTGPPLDRGPLTVDVEIVHAPGTATAAIEAPPQGPLHLPEPAPIATRIPEDALQQQAALPEPEPAPESEPASVATSDAAPADPPTGSIGQGLKDDAEATPSSPPLPSASDAIVAAPSDATPSADEGGEEEAAPSSVAHADPMPATPAPSYPTAAEIKDAGPPPPLPKRKPKVVAVQTPPPAAPAKPAAKPRVQRKAVAPSRPAPQPGLFGRPRPTQQAGQSPARAPARGAPATGLNPFFTAPKPQSPR